MIMNDRAREESSKAIFAVLLNVLDSCRQGNADIAEQIGLDIESVRRLEDLHAEQIAGVSENYMRDVCALDIFKFDANRLIKNIEIAEINSKRSKLVDDFLFNGASKVMMQDLFGLRSTQISTRKRYLGIESEKGRKAVCSEEEGDYVYNTWLAHLDIADVCQRYLKVCKDTGLPLSKIYPIVDSIEPISNLINTRKCA